jgi:glucans biosynthesis protein
MDARLMRIKDWPARAIALCLIAGHSTLAAFEFDDARALAKTLSTQPFQAVSNQVPETLASLKYEKYQAISFNHQKALWRAEELPFGLEFFLAGGLHKQAVEIHEFDDDGVRDIAFDGSLFDNPDHNLTLPAGARYAGFRIVRFAEEFGEVAVFLDASYFRMVGRGQNYGTSARGLALNTASGGAEEFPLFRQFWIRRPGKRERDITVYALMDSPSVTGAYRFVIRPGTATVTEVKAALFPRREVKEFGVAPLTSMFLFNENSHPPFRDFRPAVHDADGLLMQNGRGEWIWRPLESGRMTRVNAYQDENTLGFGLIQRDREFEHYQDLIAAFQRRPNVWVRPVGNWGKGAIELVQIASDQEPTDNIAAFWVPSAPPQIGQALELEYELRWTTNDAPPLGLGRVLATRIGRTFADPPNLRFVIEFGGGAAAALENGKPPIPVVDYGAGAVPVARDLFRNEFDQTWRLVVEIAEPSRAVDLRAFLARDNEPITETWSFTWQP